MPHVTCELYPQNELYIGLEIINVAKYNPHNKIVFLPAIAFFLLAKQNI